MPAGAERMVEFPNDVPKPERRILRKKEWKQIAEPSGLPDEAQDDIERAINWYRILRKTTENRTKNRDEMRLVSDKLLWALKALQRMKNDQDVFWSVARGGAKSNLLTEDERNAWRHRLNALTDELELGLEWWNKSMSRVKGVTKGRKNLSADLYFLIRQLSFITNEYTGKLTSLSKKEHENSKLNHLAFLVSACEVAAETNFKESLIAEIARLVMDEDRQFPGVRHKSPVQSNPK
jgi:hypothetical protein